jgi:hypothetical protein
MVEPGIIFDEPSEPEWAQQQANRKKAQRRADVQTVDRRDDETRSAQKHHRFPKLFGRNRHLQ